MLVIETCIIRGVVVRGRGFGGEKGGVRVGSVWG